MLRTLFGTKGKGVLNLCTRRPYNFIGDKRSISISNEFNAPENASNSTNEKVVISRQGKIFNIQFNRPEKYNAITWEMYEAMINALNEANQDRQTSITVFSGTGDYYCAGNDLSNFSRNVKSMDDMRKMADQGEQVLYRFVSAHIQHDKPLISLVNGPAIGISVTVLGLFDLVLASDQATFYTPFSSLGQSPEGCASYTFPTLMGASKAAEVLIFDKKLTASEAKERNLVSQIIPHAKFGEDTQAILSRISELPPESMRINKTLIRDVHREALLNVCKKECALLKQRWLSPECLQALKTFMARKGKEG